MRGSVRFLTARAFLISLRDTVKIFMPESGYFQARRTCNGHRSVGNSRNLVRKVGLRNDRYTSRRPSRGLRGEDRWSLVLVSHSVIQVVLCFETLPGSRALARPFSIYKPWESALSDVMMAWETWWCDRGWVPRSHCTAVRYQSTRPVTTILLLKGTPAS